MRSDVLSVSASVCLRERLRVCLRLRVRVRLGLRVSFLDTVEWERCLNDALNVLPQGESRSQ